MPECPKCGGVLKPDVIFFGDNVPRDKVDQVFHMVDYCDSVLVAGSSLFVSTQGNAFNSSHIYLLIEKYIRFRKVQSEAFNPPAVNPAVLQSAQEGLGTVF